ncbi:MAG: 50S ribosomal protein L9 [candidate division FCPU426 bacterium]
MKLILREDVKSLGRAGDTVTVAEGYGRNYLLPKKLAVAATPSNLKRLQQELNSKKGRERRVQLDAQYQAEELAGQPLVFTATAGEGGKLFGSVTASDIEQKLAQRGFEVDKRKIELEEPIKTLGTFKVKVKLHPEVAAELTVVVQSETPPAAEPAPEATA